MPDLDEFADEVAAELMEAAARSVTESQVKNVVGGHENLAGLSDGEYDDFLHAVLWRTADAEITIEMPRR